jgi:hypothetical protein
VLLRRCLAGDPEALRALSRRHRPRLLHLVDRLLWPSPGDPPGQVVAQHWCALVVGGCERRGRCRPAQLGALLAAVARQQLLRLSGAALRPARAFALPFPGDLSLPPDDTLLGPGLVAEFVAGLTPAEQRFYRDWLLAPPGARNVPLGGTEERLRRRVCTKFLHYLHLYSRSRFSVVLGHGRMYNTENGGIKGKGAGVSLRRPSGGVPGGPR